MLCFVVFAKQVVNFLSCLSMATSASGSSDFTSQCPRDIVRKNRLSLELSPYLLQHASNPVDWYPWGSEAFEKAVKEDKMIFLSVGYSTCHWCHVMERESFENDDVAKVMNENFVNIKVDREERPDVDKIYMTFVQATTGGGGWPMSVFLTPDLKPVLGGTYFPPDDRYYGQPGFKTILLHVSQQWQENKEKVIEQGSRILDIIAHSVSLKPSGSGCFPPSLDCIDTCYSQLCHSYDKTYGGFGSSPKFPQPVNFNFLFGMYARNPTSDEGKSSLQMSLHTLKMMARGGIHDHISQGFHRYSTDRFWHVPHFEKMLYDQGQLAVSYLDAYQISKDPFYAEVARDILEYVSRDLSDPYGGFYSAEDADSMPSSMATRKKEGAFYVWSENEVLEHLSEKVENTALTIADIFCRHYNVLQLGNVDPYQDPHEELKEKNVLIVRHSEEENAESLSVSPVVFREDLEKGRKILFEVQQKRPRPHLDDKFVTSWNGLMISGYARAAQVLQDDKYCQRAMDAAKFLHKYMFKEDSGLLLRSAYKGRDGGVAQILAPIHGVLEDYTFLIRGLLDLYEACYDPWCIHWATKLQSTQDNLFWDETEGGYFNSVSTDNSIVLRLKEDQDGAEPNPNSVAVTNLLRLSSFLDDGRLRDKATKILALYSQRLMKLPLALPEMMNGLVLYATPVTQIVIVGNQDSKDTRALLACVHQHFLPFKVLILDDGSSENILHRRLSLLNLETKNGEATVYVCQNNTCSLPVSSVHDLKKLLLEKSQSCTF